MKRRTPWAAIVGFGLLTLLLVAAPAIAGDTVAEIVLMLEGGLSEELIVEWLQAGDQTLERPGAQELLALKTAGASEGLLRELLKRSGPAVEAPSATKAAAAPTPVSRTAVPAPEPGSETSPPASRLESVAAAVDESPNTVRSVEAEGSAVLFRLLYAPRFDEDEEPWDLLVYLDGRPLTYVPTSSEMMGLVAAEPLELEMRLPQGRHTLRVLQERHQKRRRGWRHFARAAAPAFAFDLAGSAPARVELEFRQGWGALNDPLTFRFTQSDRVAAQEETGGDPDRWPLVCEDSGRAVGQGGCVGWESLWPDGAPPPRSKVLEALARFDFRPVPR